MTKLSDYLKQGAIKQADFAALVGLSQATVSRLASGALSPSLFVALRIERETRGEVPVSSWEEPATEDSAA